MLNRLVGHYSELTFRTDHLHSACSRNYLLHTSERGNSIIEPRYWIMRFGFFLCEKIGEGVHAPAYGHISTRLTVLWTNSQKSQNTASKGNKGA